MIHVSLWYVLLAGAGVVLVLLGQWQWLKHRFHVRWMDYASDKARAIAIEARKQAARSDADKRALESENAELRGMVAAGRQALAEPRRLALVERRAR